MSPLKSLRHPWQKLCSLLLIAQLTPILTTNAQPPIPEENSNNEDSNNIELTIVRPLTADNLFSMAGAERLQTEATNAISAQNYPLAIQKLQESRQVFNQLSNFHLQLANQFQGLNNNISNARRRSAFEAGQKRDEVTYLLAVTHEEAGEAPLAIPLLIQVLESQLPSSELGIKAYQHLIALGFSPIPLPNTNPNDREPSENNNPEIPSSAPHQLFSFTAGENLMSQAQARIDQQDYSGAIAKLQEARQMFQQLSSLHLRLANVFQGINPDIFADQRQRAFETGQKRDETTYQMALIHRQQNQAPLAIPLLIQVINSQSPANDLGRKAYQQLYDLGFVDIPYRN